MKKTLQIAFGVAIGLSLHSLAQLAVTVKFFEAVADTFHQTFTHQQVPGPSIQDNRSNLVRLVHFQRLQAEALRKEREAKERQWRRYFQPRPECESYDVEWSKIVECANESIRARQAFEAWYVSTENE